MKLYLEIAVKKYNGHDNKLLTYEANVEQKSDDIEIGSVVEVPFRNTTSLGVVYTISHRRPKKSIVLKSITRVLPLKPLPTHLLRLADWLESYYLATPAQIWSAILPSGLQINPRATKQAETQPITPQISPHRLNIDQKKAVETIIHAQATNFLLHGVTGSGKTEVYVRLAQNTLAEGRSVVILVPEISLTPQTVTYFESRLQKPVVLTHSKLNTSARRRIWRQILDSKEPQIVIGPRSVLFLPYSNLGLIIVDEAHESGSYKQTGGLHYNALHVAAQLVRLNHARYILGSATPGITEYWLAQKGRLELVELPVRAGGGRAPQAEIIRLDKTKGLLSQTLKSAIADTLAQHKQVLLFLNRRGSANAQICTNCGYIARCKRCDMVMSFHAARTKLVCHSCGWQTTPSAICPDCDQSDTLIFIGAGTQKVEDLIKQQFAEARIARLDGDTATLEHIFQTYAQMLAGEIDILIGTQMIARGLDLPNVTLVGVILADGMLSLPDFNASERAFALMTQVVGRAGRRDKQSRALIQTYLPRNAVIEFAASEDYRGFYEQELATRSQYHYPPFVYLLKATIFRRRSASAQTKATQTAQHIRRKYRGIEVLGPAQPVHYRGPRGFGWQLLMKATSRQKLAEIAQNELAEWTIDLDPITII